CPYPDSQCIHRFRLYPYRDLRDLRSFPTRRSSDLTFTPERFFQLSPAHVSLYFSPACGIEWNVHASLPVRMSQARISPAGPCGGDRKSTRLNSSHVAISYAVFCLKKKSSRRPKRRW